MNKKNSNKFFLSQTMEEFEEPANGIKYFQTLSNLYNKILLNDEKFQYKFSREQFFNFLISELNKSQTIFNWENGIYNNDKNDIYLNFPNKKEVNKLIKILNKFFT